MAISHEDRQWFKDTVEQALISRDAHCEKVVAKAMEKHNREALAHNPVKSAGLFASLAVVWEFLRSLFLHNTK